MENQKEKLIAEISEEKIKYGVFRLDSNLEIEMLTEKVTKNIEIKKGNILNFENVIKIIGEDLKLIEKKLNKIFRNISVIVNQKEVLCTNITGFKKLNGSKVEKRDLDYILNEAKSSIVKNQEKNSILHILNSNFILDKNKQDTIPLSMFGDHLSLHMTFLTLPKNNIKNINMIFNNNDLKVDRIIAKPFVCGIDLFNQEKNLKNFIVINFENELSSVALYENSSLIFLKTFPFGTNSIFNDITQLCSLRKDEIKLMINEIDFNIQNIDNSKYLDKKFFIKSDFTKLSINHIKNIINSRIKEMLDYAYNKNNNLKYIFNKIPTVHLFFEDQAILKNLNRLFEKSLILERNNILCKSFLLNEFSALNGAAELILKGWHKEAIPFKDKKKSIIAGFFSRFF